MTTGKLEIYIRGVGHIPSFKNSKMLTRGKIITKPAYQKQMKLITDAIESQLRSALAMRGIGTTTGPIPPSRIASLLPLDDSRKWVTESYTNTRLVSKGNEGADITIERI
jgi:hypothetical protein